VTVVTELERPKDYGLGSARLGIPLDSRPVQGCPLRHGLSFLRHNLSFIVLGGAHTPAEERFRLFYTCGDILPPG